MTDDEMKLLESCSIDIELLHKGYLHDWKKEVLNQYHFVMNYLQQKYPSHIFQLKRCEPKDVFHLLYDICYDGRSR